MKNEIIFGLTRQVRKSFWLALHKSLRTLNKKRSERRIEFNFPLIISQYFLRMEFCKSLSNKAITFYTQELKRAI